MIIMKLKGGMGNQMFQYAFGRTLAKRFQTNLKLDLSFLRSQYFRQGLVLRNYDLDLYDVDASIADPSDIRKLTIYVDESQLNLKRHIQKSAQRIYSWMSNKHLVEKGHFYDAVLVEKAGKNGYYDGYWQSEKYFKDIESTIREDFTFKVPLGEPAHNLSKKIIAVDAIAIFVRRTDFLGNPSHIMLDETQMLRGINFLKKRTRTPHLFIFSDEIEWCQQNLIFDLPTFFVTEEYKGSRFTDHFRLMTLCKHFIIPISSFAWWAAWLCNYSEKTVLYAQNTLYPDWAAESWLEINDNLD